MYQLFAFNLNYRQESLLKTRTCNAIYNKSLFTLKSLINT